MSGKMTTADAARIQSSMAKANGGFTTSNSFASRAQSAAANNVNKGFTQHNGGKKK